MMTKFIEIIIWGSIFLLLTNCSGDEPISKNSLQSYLESTGLEIQRDSLIACAASGQVGILSGEDSRPISILYYPLKEISDVKYFESTASDVDEFDFYEEKALDTSPLFNGILRSFNREAPDRNISCIVTFIRNSKLFISNPIKIKSQSNPTNFNNDIIIDRKTSLMPKFNWGNSTSDQDAIYFQVLSDPEGNMISGTYTFDSEFQFYELENVVLNITQEETPTLQLSENYQFAVMGVSEDNWVNFISMVDFKAF